MASDVLNGRYQLERQLGQGGQAKTWLALDMQTEQQVVIKHLSLKEMERWKQIELFEREGEVLKGLEHGQVPEYVDMFVDLEGEQADFYLVQEFIDGLTLAEELSSLGCWDQEKAVDDLRSMLEVLHWLQQRVPPVIHRDIKPTNMMRRQDGALVLIDFGAVQLAGTDASFASTFVGTASYMAFEQMSGKALPASDVYSLGVSFCQLLTGVPPSQVEMDGNALGYASLLREVGVSGRLLEVLERMIQLSLNERYPNAGAALRALNREVGRGTVTLDGPMVPVTNEVELRLLLGEKRRAFVDRLDVADFRGSGFFSAGYVERQLTPELHEQNGYSKDATRAGFEFRQYQDWFAFPFKESLAFYQDESGVVNMLDVLGVKFQSQNESPMKRNNELITVFEDGYYIVTRRAREGSNDDTHRVVVGRRDFYHDYQEHMKAVRRYAAQENVAVVPHLNLEEIHAIYKDMRTHTASKNRLVLSLGLFGVPVLWGLLTWFFRRASSENKSTEYRQPSWKLVEQDALDQDDGDDVVRVKLDFETTAVQKQEQPEGVTFTIGA